MVLSQRGGVASAGPHSGLAGRRRAAAGGLLAAVLLAGALAGGCRHLTAGESTPPAPHRPWPAPPAPVADPSTGASAPGASDPAAGVAAGTVDQAAAVATAKVPPHLAAAIAAQGGLLALPQALDLALRNSPRTRDTWLAARAAAAEVESRRAEQWPQASLTGELERARVSAVGGQFNFQQTTYGPGVELSWLLFDFGGRAADVAEARQLLLAANFVHNQALQDVVLDVSAAYYRYLSARALREAALADLAGAEANLEAADRRHQAGLATIADVLQARTAVSSARLGLLRAEGEMQVIRGALATAMGLPPDLPVEAAPLPEEVPVSAASEGVEVALARALRLRPDLLAARARAAAAVAGIAQERADGLPSLLLRGTGGRTYYDVAGRDPGDNASAQLLVRVPLFSGFEHRWDVERARQEAARAAAQSETLEQQVQLQVWTSYHDLRTAAQRFATAEDLLAAAQESARVAAGRYQAGVGSILDLLAAQSVLAEARAQRILARADWLVALARLARATGSLELPAVAAEASDETPGPEPPSAAEP